MNTPDPAELLRLLEVDHLAPVEELCTENHPADVAEALSLLEPREVRRILRLLDGETRAEVFSHLQQEFQGEVLTVLGRLEAAKLLTDMAHDDRADLFKSLSEEKQGEILPAMAQAEREDIRRLTSYPEGTAGAVMTSDYATLHRDLTAAGAIESLREAAPDTETIYTSYVVNENRELLGYVKLQDLIVAGRNRRVHEIMEKEVISVRATDDQEDAARKIQKYDLIALPVIDENKAIVGIITHDDALDIITQENTEDLEKIMAISGAHESFSYMKTGPMEHFRNRVYWISGLAVLGIISGFVIQRFEGILLQFAVLATFLPMLAAAGGNTGSQSATLVIRALALREISAGDAGLILWREFRVSLLLGILLGLFAYGRVVLLGVGSSIPPGYSLHAVGFAISLALALQVVSSTVTGALLPLGALRLRLDPAVVASPALASVVDVTGVLIYFTTVKLMLGL